MLISKADFNDQKVFEIFQAAYMDVKMDDDGDVIAMIDGIRVRALAAKDRPFFIVSGMYAAKEGTTREQLLELANRFNDQMIMVRCSIPKIERPMVYFDHFTMTEGGITAEEIVRVTQRFAKIMREGIQSCDTEDIIK